MTCDVTNRRAVNVRYELAIFGAFVAFFVILFALSVGGIAV